MKIQHQPFSKMFGRLLLILITSVSSQAAEIITGDLDITGNIVTLGTLDEVTPTSGATLQFSDISSVATLENILSRPQTAWQWSRTASSSSTSSVPVMKLDSTSGLRLPDPAAPTGSATVKIDPRPDQISMLPQLELSGQTNSGPAAVITRALGDARYLSIDATTVSIGGTGTTVGTYGIGIGTGIRAGNNSVSIGSFAGNNGSLSSTGVSSGSEAVSIGLRARGAGEKSVTLGTWTYAGGDNSITIGSDSVAYQRGGIAIGEGTESNQMGQVVLGSFNKKTDGSNTRADGDSIFVIGNGTAEGARSNAFVIKRNGSVGVQGSFVVEGQADPDNSLKITPKSGQEALVPEQGDISMGEFRSGSLPLPATP